MKLKKGTSRMTLLIGKYAFKMPITTRTLKHFVKGWLGNIDEVYLWKKLRHEKMCPIYFSFLGLINIMPRAKSANYTEFDPNWAVEYFKELPFEIDVCAGWSNFGYYKTNLVITDYAIGRTSTEHCSDCDGDCLKAKCKKI